MALSPRPGFAGRAVPPAVEPAWRSGVLPAINVHLQEFVARLSPTRPRPRFISTTQLITGALRLVPRLPPDLSAVVGVARSGLLPATALATALHLPLYALDQERRRPSVGLRLAHALA